MQYLGPQPEEPENQGMRIMKLNLHIYCKKRVRLSDNFGLYHPSNWGLPCFYELKECSSPTIKPTHGYSHPSPKRPDERGKYI